MSDLACRVYWGSHGCHRVRGHSGRHFCCCDCGPGWVHRLRGRLWNVPGLRWLYGGCVGTAPYYGRRTTFYGEDA